MTLRNFSPVLAVILGSLPHFPGECHDSLYDYLEIRVEEDGTAEYVLSVHAPDFLLAPTFAVDALEDDWFPKLTPDEQSALIGLANQSIGESLILRKNGADENALARLPIALIPSNAEIDATTRPDSLIASATIPDDCNSLSVHYAGEKRLMVVINRPGRFPEVHDLAPENEIQLSISTTSPTEP